MNIVVIYGSEHRGSTYNIAQLFLKKLRPETDSIKEYFLPEAMPHFCQGCASCIMKGESKCPHYNIVNPIKGDMENADLLIFTSPVYVLHTTGQMKAFLDHFAYFFMVHRPSKSMFSKMALIISTAAGAGMKSAIRDISDSLNYWGVGRIYKYGKAVKAISWQSVSEKDKMAIQKAVDKYSSRIIKKMNKVTPGIKVKSLFYIMRAMHKKFYINEIDKAYWKGQGWLDSARPWKS
jgi:Multimeric flavodoxin WrbA